SQEERKVFELLKEVKAISAKIPGSSASKLSSRNQIRGYMGLFGMPIIFFTYNPNAVHSAMFQVIFGDDHVDLKARFPTLVEYNERVRRLAKDPVAAADFF
ncbi:hypothetical protein B0H16DRAFT_1325742, partial [Mycena metata]